MGDLSQRYFPNEEKNANAVNISAKRRQQQHNQLGVAA